MLASGPLSSDDKSCSPQLWTGIFLLLQYIYVVQKQVDPAVFLNLLLKSNWNIFLLSYFEEAGSLDMYEPSQLREIERE